MADPLDDCSTDLVQGAKVLIGMPNYTNLMTSEVHSNHLDCSVSWSNRGIKFNWSIVGRTFVHFARTQVCQAAIDGGYTHIFWVDDDALVPWQILPRFINHDVDVVMAPYPMRRPPYQIGVLKSTVGDFHNHESYRNFTLADLDQGLVEVDGGGTHCMLVKTDVLRMSGALEGASREVAYPPDLMEMIETLSAEQRKIIDHYVGDLPDESLSLMEEDDLGKPYFMMPKSGTEDMYFCYRAKKKGAKIWCDTDVFASHVGFAPTITKDHTRLCEDRAANGQDPRKGIPVSRVQEGIRPMESTDSQAVPTLRQSAVDTGRPTSLI